MMHPLTHKIALHLQPTDDDTLNIIDYTIRKYIGEKSRQDKDGNPNWQQSPGCTCGTMIDCRIHRPQPKLPSKIEIYSNEPYQESASNYIARTVNSILDYLQKKGV